MSSCILLDSETNGTGTGYGRFVRIVGDARRVFLLLRDGSRGRGARARCEHVRADSKPDHLRAADAARHADEVIPIASGHTLTIAYDSWTTFLQQSPNPDPRLYDRAACGLAAATAGEPAAATAVEPAAATAVQPAVATAGEPADLPLGARLLAAERRRDGPLLEAR